MSGLTRIGVKLIYLLIVYLFAFSATAYGGLAGGRPNAFSVGQNALAGVVNPANAVWIADRVDVGAFWVNQKSSITNHDNNPLFPPGKVDLTYGTKNLFSGDGAIHKQLKLKLGSMDIDSSFSLAAYTFPATVKLRTDKNISGLGTTPVGISNKTDVLSSIFSFKLNQCHSIGFTIDYYYFSHSREGFQNSDNPARSVSPGHVTNKGTDHSKGFGCSIGWRWKIRKDLDFGMAWSKKSYCGQFRRYRGFEPYHAQNYTPQIIGGGVTYRHTSKLAGHLEMLWLNLGDLPNANNNILHDGSLNLNKRGSNKSPGPGLQNATYLNIGIGYKLNTVISVGGSFSHRFKLHKGPNFLSHTYVIQTIYEVVALGFQFNLTKHDIFLGYSYGLRNSASGLMPVELGGGRFTGEKQNSSLSLSWGYKY